MPNWWAVEHLDVEKLLADWRWLCPQSLTLVARNAFGDLFLHDGDGRLFRLDVAIGEFKKVADSEVEFIESTDAPENRREWFAESDERGFASRGLIPGPDQCIGFSVPLVFAKAGSPDTA
jgi:hypothetical protein